MRTRTAARPLAFLLIAIAFWAAPPIPRADAAQWVAPLPEPLTITRSFDPPERPYGAGHRGVDLAGFAGQEVRAAGAGTVVYAGPLAGRGVVSIEHADGLRTTYEPLSATIPAGMPVGLGEVIGHLESGHPGCPADACLHWGLKRGGTYLDPLLLLSQGPVRLLPRYGDGRAAETLDPVPVAISLGLGSALLGAGLLDPLRRRRRSFRRVDGLGDRRS